MSPQERAEKALEGVRMYRRDEVAESVANAITEAIEEQRQTDALIAKNYAEFLKLQPQISGTYRDGMIMGAFDTMDWINGSPPPQWVRWLALKEDSDGG